MLENRRSIESREPDAPGFCAPAVLYLILLALNSEQDTKR
jgi:hypothetical protein